MTATWQMVHDISLIRWGEMFSVAMLKYDQGWKSNLSFTKNGNLRNMII